MFSALLKGVIGFFSGGIGNKIGTVLTDGAALAAIVPAVIWLVTHKDDIAVSLTWGQLGVTGMIVFAVIKVAHYTRAGRESDRNDFRP